MSKEEHASKGKSQNTQSWAYKDGCDRRFEIENHSWGHGEARHNGKITFIDLSSKFQVIKTLTPKAASQPIIKMIMFTIQYEVCQSFAK